MNLESRKFRLIEKIVSLRDEILLSKLEDTLTLTETIVTATVVPQPEKKEGLILRNTRYKISDRPQTVETKQTLNGKNNPTVQNTESDDSDSLNKLQRLVTFRSTQKDL